MSIKITMYEDGLTKLVDLAINRKLIPFFGSGFTCGCPSFRKKVPNGSDAVKIMNDLIIKSSNGKINEKDLNQNFIETSELFYNIVDIEKRNKFFGDYFINVTIENYKKEFLEIDWPYAYTINIDDGIEKTGIFTEILPYKTLNKRYNSSKYLYKLHGDANYETKYANDENIVFNLTQYINSIKSDHNKDFYNNLLNDYLKNNILFIGCSMYNEPDLKAIFEELPEKSSNSRIIIRDSEPTFKEDKMLSSHGINEIIIVKNFESFYTDFLDLYKKEISKKETEQYKFYNSEIKTISDKTESIKYFSGINIFDEKTNSFYKSGMHIVRSCMEELISQLNEYSCVVLKGRRFSGKTFLLCSLIEYESRYKKYFFPSNIQIDCYFAKELFNKKNCLFIFDSNSISTEVYKLLGSSRDKLKRNNNKVVIATNTSENYIIGVLDAGLVELDGKLDKKELSDLNKIADKFALLRRTDKQTNLDYLQKLSIEQRISIDAINKLPKELVFFENIMLFLLAVNDKIYYSDAIALEILPNAITDFVNRFEILVEEIPTETNEKSNHSTTKIIHNSKLIILDLISKLDKENIIEMICYIVKKLKNDRFRERIYINVILFDTLNQIFGGKTGAGNLIFEVYEALEKSLYDSPDYWLQRSKSIYRIAPEELVKLKEAYGYAKKAYFDGDGNMKLKSSLTLSLISGCLFQQESDEAKKIEYQKECINKGYEAAFSQYYQRNSKFLNNELRGGRMRKNSYDMLFSICGNVIATTEDNYLKQKATKLKERLEDLQLEWKKS